MSINVKDVWDKALVDLKAQVSDQTYNAWFLLIQPLSLENEIFTLGVPNDLIKEWISERHSSLIKSSISSILGKPVSVSFAIYKNPDAVEIELKPSPKDESRQQEKKGIFGALFAKHSPETPSQATGINSKYTLDNFVVGPSNRIAHAACTGACEELAKTYNPLFIYGGVGLGKTHLMHAAGNFIMQKTPRAKILYISSEEFTNQLIAAIQTRTMQKFRQMYRTVDVILIDDIHFIAGKESTQEEFFHTFNALHDAHKQIIMSSDRSPKEIPDLEERLVSRFLWGFVADIQPPDFETRMAILKKKSELETIRVPDDVLFFLAENIRSNIRELEGALIRVVAYSKLDGKNVSVDLAKDVLKGMIKEGGKKVNVDLIQRKVSEYFNITVVEMKAKKRTQAIAYPRQIAMYLSRDLTNLSLPEIGSYFGGRDHTTVIHACNKIEKDIKQDEEVKGIVEQILVSIRS